MSELPEKIERAFGDLLADIGPPDKIMQPLVDALRAAIREALDEAARHPSLDEALNSGDGVYRP